VFLLQEETNSFLKAIEEANKKMQAAEKGTTEDEMVRWHHRLNGHEFG